MWYFVCLLQILRKKLTCAILTSYVALRIGRTELGLYRCEWKSLCCRTFLYPGFWKKDDSWCVKYIVFRTSNLISYSILSFSRANAGPNTNGSQCKVLQIQLSNSVKWTTAACFLDSPSDPSGSYRAMPYTHMFNLSPWNNIQFILKSFCAQPTLLG